MLIINNYLFAKEELIHLKEQFSNDFKVGVD